MVQGLEKNLKRKYNNMKKLLYTIILIVEYGIMKRL